MQVTGQATIFKNDKGVYKLSVMNKELQEDGTEKSAFMPIHVGFIKGVEVKNKTKIDIKNGFLTFFKIDTGEVNDEGKPIYKKFPKIMVMEFEVIEEGIDEVQQTRDYSNKQNNFSDDVFGGYYPETNVDDLPF